MIRVYTAAVFALMSANIAQSQDIIPVFYIFTSAEVVGEPGSLVRAEAIEDGDTNHAAFRFLYRTTDASAEPTIASAMLVIPTEPSDILAKTVVWAHDSVGIAARCAPSLQPSPLSELKGLEKTIEAGHVMVAPDYVGLGAIREDAPSSLHSYFDAPSAAAAVIDSVLAAQELVKRLGEFDESAPNIRLSEEFSIYGHSQGAHAGLAAAIKLLASDSGPILRGLALSGVPNRITSILPMQRTSEGLILTAQILGAYQYHYDNLDPRDLVVEPLAALVPLASQNCLEDLQRAILGEGDPKLVEALSDFDIPLDGSHIRALPRAWLSKMRENTPTESFSRSQNTKAQLTGIHIAQGGTDTLIPTFETLFGFLRPVCAAFQQNGVIIDYAVLDGHTETQQLTEDRAMAYLLSSLGVDVDFPPVPAGAVSLSCADIG